MKLKRLPDFQFDKENLLVQNILKNPSRKNKKSLSFPKQPPQNNLSNIGKRYDSIETKLTEGESIELPTFGNWKQKIKIDQQIHNDRLRLYEKQRVKEVIESSQEHKKQRKTKQIDIFATKLGDRVAFSSKQPKRKSVVEDLWSQRPIQVIKTMETRSISRRKKTFEELYLKQKGQYEKILKKHGIIERVDDSQFQIFLNLC